MEDFIIDSVINVAVKEHCVVSSRNAILSGVLAGLTSDICMDSYLELYMIPKVSRAIIDDIVHKQDIVLSHQIRKHKDRMVQDTCQ